MEGISNSISAAIATAICIIICSALAEYFGFDYVRTMLTLLLYTYFRQNTKGGEHE